MLAIGKSDLNREKRAISRQVAYKSGTPTRELSDSNLEISSYELGSGISS